MQFSATYVHTSIVAQDWKRLARFYVQVFGCTLLLPERDLMGTEVETATGVPGARIRGAHLLLPGRGATGPTLEIFQYDPAADRVAPAINRPGLAHIAFAVDDVEAALNAVRAWGGDSVGQVVSVNVTGKGTVTFAYLHDPEGNIVEVQRWSTRTIVEADSG